MAVAGTSIDDLGAVLDWGVGCSRIMRQWAPLFGTISFTGTDIDQRMIDWDVANIPGPRFAVNGAEPPLPCGDEEFDLAYGASVFTHLDEAMQQRWLAELARVLKPGGVLLLSTHGPSVFELNRHTFSDTEVAAFRDHGFVYIRNIVDGVLPDWYQTSFQTSDHVRRTFGEHFEVIDHVTKGMAGFQDLAICRKPPATALAAATPSGRRHRQGSPRCVHLRDATATPQGEGGVARDRRWAIMASLARLLIEIIEVRWVR